MKQARERFQDMISRQLYETILVDSHFSVYENKKLVKAIDDEEIELYNTFILVDVPTDILHSRISQDNKERTRESCDRKKIHQHRTYERAIAEEVKKRCGRELIEVENMDLKETVKKIEERIIETKVK
jgi:adenylate kinase